MTPPLPRAGFFVSTVFRPCIDPYAGKNSIVGCWVGICLKNEKGFHFYFHHRTFTSKYSPKFIGKIKMKKVFKKNSVTFSPQNFFLKIFSFFFRPKNFYSRKIFTTEFFSENFFILIFPTKLLLQKNIHHRIFF